MKPFRREIDLDDYDFKLLNALQENNQRTSDELAELVHLSPASCLRRVKRLRELKVISADISVVDPDVFGPRMKMIVLVFMESERRDLIEAFRQDVAKRPQVLQYYYVAGGADFVLILSMRDMEEYDAFTRQVFFGNSNVKRFETMVAMDGSRAPHGAPRSPPLGRPPDR